MSKFCYVQPPTSNEFVTTETPLPLESFEETVTNINQDGTVTKTTVKKDSSDHPLKGLKAKDFDLELLVATGSTGLLKETPLISGDRLSQLDSIESHAEYLSTLNSSSNG